MNGAVFAKCGCPSTRANCRSEKIFFLRNGEFPLPSNTLSVRKLVEIAAVLPLRITALADRESLRSTALYTDSLLEGGLLVPANIVLLNLGDRAPGGGLIAKSATSLRRKYPVSSTLLFAGNQITELSLFSLLAKYQAGAGALARSDPQLLQVRNLCSSATKIMLCLHGLHNDVLSGFANDTLNHTPMAAVASFADLAGFTLMFLPLRDKIYNLALIMCYGARSDNFRLNHEGQIAPDDLKTSFAYKFYRRICMFRNVRMTARTGATGFDEHTGRSTVESEASVQARADNEDFLRLVATQTAIDDYKNLKDSYTKAAHGGSEERARAWLQMDNNFRANPDLAASNPDEAGIKAYHQVLKTKNAYQDAMGGQDRTKYGKYIYAYTPKDGLTIFSKYPKPGVVLYHGPLL